MPSDDSSAQTSEPSIIPESPEAVNNGVDDEESNLARSRERGIKISLDTRFRVSDSDDDDDDVTDDEISNAKDVQEVCEADRARKTYQISDDVQPKNIFLVSKFGQVVRTYLQVKNFS